MSPTPPLPTEHELLDVLRVDEHEWVLRTRFVGREGLTRIFRSPILEDHQDALTAGALGGPPLPEALPWELRRVVEGYRVRAALPPEWALPAVLDAGLVDGHPYLTRAWIDGEPLGRCWPELSPTEGDAALAQLADILAALHAADVVYQDLKPDNVVRDRDGRAWIVDLESFRRVDASGWVPWTHLSPAFAAPEQLRGLSCRASDVYTFGRLVQTLGADAERGSEAVSWRLVALACVAAEWSERPSAAELARWARGEAPPPRAVTETIRVPDLALDEPTSTGVVVRVPPPPPPPPAGPRRPWIRPIGAVALAGLLAASVWGAADEVARERAAAREAVRAEAASLADAGWAALRAHKVEAARNNDGDLSAAIVLLQQAAALDPDHLDAHARLALGAVWAHRWHWDNATWSADDHAQARAAVDAARAIGLTRELELAEGLLDGARCRLDGSAGASESCGVAVERLDRAARIARDWLAVEATWGAVVVYRDLALRAQAAGDPTEARGLANQALRRCQGIEDTLPRAPVNNVELARDCVIVAGIARDTRAWWDWGQWIARDAVVRHGAVRKREVALLVTSPSPECADVRLRDDGWPKDLDQASVWCRSMAEWVLRCDEAPTPRWCPARPRYRLGDPAR